MPIGIQEKQTDDPFGAFVDRINTPREVIQETVIPEPEPIEPESLSGSDEPSPEIPDPSLEEKKMKVAQIPAKIVVNVIDTAAVSLNSYIAKEPQDGATDNEKESLQDAVANYLRDTGVDISPGKLVLVLVLMIYGPKTMQAFQVRKQHQENAALKEQIAELEYQLAAQNRANEVKDGKEVPNM